MYLGAGSVILLVALMRIVAETGARAGQKARANRALTPSQGPFYAPRGTLEVVE